MVHCSTIGLVISIFIVSFSLSSSQSYDPCCSFPCQNRGICLSKDVNIYKCDCTGTGYYGTNCETPSFSTRINRILKPFNDAFLYITRQKIFWKFANQVRWLRAYFMKRLLKARISTLAAPSLYRGFDSYPTWQGYANNSMYARALPPVPHNCPTPMGVKGKATLPDAQIVIDKFFTRRTFEPCPRQTSVTFAYFAQHFSHQFLKTDWEKGMPWQWGDHAIDLSHIYGDTLERQHGLRSHVDGKLKYSIINNEVFPPLRNETNLFWPDEQKPNEHLKFAIGHKSEFSPFLVFATIWLREHNRVCDILKKENPAWDDERLFQTARLILTGETMKVVIEDYIQHISGFHFQMLYDPTLLHDVPVGYSYQIHSEFNLIYHLHAVVPDYIQLGDHVHPLSDVLFDPNPMLQAGLSEVIASGSRQFAGKMLAGQGKDTLPVAKRALLDGRRLRLQSLNNYRKEFDLVPYKSFEDFTGEKIMAKELEKLYGDIDALEFFVGVLLEKRQEGKLFGETLTDMIGAYAFRGIMSNAIGSPAWWKPSTFGGQKGFDIIRDTDLQKLICRNLEGCPSVSFRVPDGVDYVPFDITQVKARSAKIQRKADDQQHQNSESWNADSSDDDSAKHTSQSDKTEL